MLAGVSEPSQPPVGVVLAGGLGRRIGGAKATTELAGHPLIEYPLRALAAVLAEVRVVAKPDTALPQHLAGPQARSGMPGPRGVEVWIEPAEPHHPLVGIAHALRMAGPRGVLVCAADMPFLTAEVLARLAYAEAGGAPAVVAVGASGRSEPLLGRYEPAAAALLADAALAACEPLRSVVARLGPRLVPVDAAVLFNVNTREDLARAEAEGDLGRVWAQTDQSRCERAYGDGC
jgi:molybdopterin-guanine dinucleotide biosynthesis protein A